jgi:chromosomal replication initiator protein
MNKIFNKNFTFDTFVVGPGNEFAKSSALAVAKSPGKTKFNPLLIYGGTGLGKTHLLYSIGNYVLSNFSDISISFVTSEEFYYNFIDSIKNNNVRNFSESYKKLDILLIDDIQFFSGKESTQEEFFNIFNNLYQNQKQIVLTSDLHPNSLKGIQERLISRFQWGLCVDIQPPDLETRIAIVKKKSEQNNLTISDDVLLYIAENVSSNIREIEGIIVKLLAYSSITKCDINLDLVKKFINLSKPKERNVPSIEKIIEVVSEYYKIPINNIKEKNRRKEVAICRQIAMYISKNLTNFSLKTIGLYFGGRDHSTVIHAINTIENMKQNNQNILNDIENIKALLM